MVVSIGGGNEMIAPRLNPEDVRVFLAEDSGHKRDSIISSLGAYGLDRSITVAKTYDEALAFIEAQTPHSMDANIFLFDGGLHPDNPKSLRDGERLATVLFEKFSRPLTEVIGNASTQLADLGLTNKQQDSIFGYGTFDAVRSIARQQMQSEALLAGVSAVQDGGVGWSAQFPWTDYEKIGPTVFQAVVPKKIRQRIERQSGIGRAVRS